MTVITSPNECNFAQIEAGMGIPGNLQRTYSVRRIKDAFREHKEDSDYERIDDLITFAKINLEIIKRQVLIGDLYREPETVIEHHLKSNKSNQ
ncbi:uncharacterized protein NPIL_152141 [Nephila pilipes]|uniref:Complex 1 LYR protein domain-containing protein n=1 Tax=Nephila pilipes TaxID=299642 RepID=A0A8X6NPB9_NEPPI|nr:uncharacterized protein NPIL_152141 [Nephila pilipes]